MKDSVTVTIGKQPDSPFITFKQFDIIKTNNHPIFGTCWNIVTTDTESMKIDDSYKVLIKMRKLNTSKWPIIRKIQLKIIKKLLALVLILIFVASCQKSNLPTIEKWVVKQYKDHTTWSRAFTCDSSEFIGIDTIEIKLYSGYDPNKFSYTAGSIYLESQPPLNILDTVYRYYANLLYKLP